MEISDSEDDLIAVPAHVLSMTDEEGDIMPFRSYLQTLPPESLWDIAAHIDAERYPLRVQAAQREIARRRLFFVSPYTAFESRLRGLFALAVGAAILAAALREIGSVYVPLDPGEHLCWFYDLAIGGPAAARMVFPIAGLLAGAGAFVSILGLFGGAWHYLHHKVRPDVLVTGFVAVLLIAGFLTIASGR